MKYAFRLILVFCRYLNFHANIIMVTKLLSLFSLLLQSFASVQPVHSSWRVLAGRLALTSAHLICQCGASFGPGPRTFTSSLDATLVMCRWKVLRIGEIGKLELESEEIGRCSVSRCWWFLVVSYFADTRPSFWSMNFWWSELFSGYCLPLLGESRGK